MQMPLHTESSIQELCIMYAQDCPVLTSGLKQAVAGMMHPNWLVSGQIAAARTRCWESGQNCKTTNSLHSLSVSVPRFCHGLQAYLYDKLRDSSKGTASMPFVKFRKCLQAGSLGNAGIVGTEPGATAGFALHKAGL